MKNKRSAFLCVLMCIVLVASLFSACSVKPDPIETSTGAVNDPTWGVTPDDTANLPQMIITGADLGELVEGALGEEFKDFNDDNLNSLTQDQQQAVIDYAEDKGYIVEEDEDGKTVIKVPVEEVPEEDIQEILTQASVQDPENMTPEESEKVSELLEENSIKVTQNDKGEIDYVKPVYTTKPVTTKAPATAAPTKEPIVTDKEGEIVVPTKEAPTYIYVKPTTGDVAPMGTTLPKTEIISSGWMKPYAVPYSEIGVSGTGNATTAYAANAVTPDGGVVSVGTALSSVPEGGSAFSAIIVKYDKNGDQVWKDRITLDKSIAFDSVDVLADGSIIAAGYTYAAGLEPSIYKCVNTVEAVMVKYSANGQKVWDNASLAKDYGIKIIGGSGDEEIHTVEPTADGGFLIGGKTTSADFDFRDTGSAKIKSFLIKCDANGNIKWRSVLGGTKHSAVEDAAVDNNGNIFVTIDVRTGTDDYAKYEGAKDGKFTTLIRKLDANGNEIWSKFYYESGNTQLLHIVPTNDGGCVVAGQYSVSKEGNAHSFADIYNGGNAGTYDGIVVKLGANGNQRWAKPIIGFKTELISGLVKVNGGYAISGYTTSTNRDFEAMPGLGGYDSFIYAISEHGELQTMSAFGGSGVDRILSIASDGKSTVHACGTTNSVDGFFANSPIKSSGETLVAFECQQILS